MILLLIRRTDEFMFGLLFAVLVQLFEILCYYSVVVDVRVALICLVSLVRYLFVCCEGCWLDTCIDRR